MTNSRLSDDGSSITSTSRTMLGCDSFFMIAISRTNCSALTASYAACRPRPLVVQADMASAPPPRPPLPAKSPSPPCRRRERASAAMMDSSSCPPPPLPREADTALTHGSSSDTRPMGITGMLCAPLIEVVVVAVAVVLMRPGP